MALISSALAGVVILGYSIFVSLPFIMGPFLSIDTPTYLNGTVTLSGKTERVSFLEINGYATALNEDGSFSVLRAYPLGYTAVTVTAKDRFGRTITKDMSFVTDEYGIKKEE